jgi:hypothetical protein
MGRSEQAHCDVPNTLEVGIDDIVTRAASGGRCYAGGGFSLAEVLSAKMADVLRDLDRYRERMRRF